MTYKKCPFCASKATICCGETAQCSNDKCRLYNVVFRIKEWNKRLRREPTMTSLAKKACTLAQLWARLEGTDYNGYGKCWYCGCVKSWVDLNGCHWLPKGRTYRAACIDPRNIHPGCQMCNNLNDGHRYTMNMQEKYGKDVLEELEQLNHQESRREDFAEYIAETRKKCRELAKKKNFTVNVP